MEKKSKQLMGIIGIVAAVAIIILLVVAISHNKKALNGSYRNISVFDVLGNVKVSRDSEDVEPYINMKLLSGDIATTGAGSYLQMLLDEDKYVHIEPDSEVSFELSGTAQDSKTTFNLTKGTIVNSIHEKLSENSEYKINTPNSTMAVRGTSYRVSVYLDSKGVYHTLLEVLSGTVEVHLINPDGSISEEATFLEAGTSGEIVMDDDNTEWVFSDGTVEPETFPKDTLEFLNLMIDDGEELVISKEKIEELVGKGKGEINSESKEEEEETEGTEPENDKTPVKKPGKTKTDSDATNSASGEGTPAPTPAPTPTPTPTPTPAPTPTPEPAPPSTDDQTPSQEETETKTECTVTFLNPDGSTFGTQKVEAGQTIAAPKLMPTQKGHWNFDFSAQVTEDTTISWTAE